MLEGTDLFSAYQPLQPTHASYEPEERVEKKQEPKMEEVTKRVDTSASSNSLYSAETFNKQYEQEQKILMALNNMQKQKQVEQYTPTNVQPSYIDKLFSKKKELGRLLQFSMIILLALSLHLVIKHYLKIYISERDLSFERELFIRILYPLAILFILWNLKVFLR